MHRSGPSGTYPAHGLPLFWMGLDDCTYGAEGVEQRASMMHRNAAYRAEQRFSGASDREARAIGVGRAGTREPRLSAPGQVGDPLGRVSRIAAMENHDPLIDDRENKSAFHGRFSTGPRSRAFEKQNGKDAMSTEQPQLPPEASLSERKYEIDMCLALHERSRSDVEVSDLERYEMNVEAKQPECVRYRASLFVNVDLHRERGHRERKIAQGRRLAKVSE